MNNFNLLFKGNNRIAIVVLLLSVLFLFPVANQAQNVEIKHKIQILHPGLDSAEKQNCILIEVQDSIGKATQYYRDVESVICEDHLCKIEKVRIFWDKYGTYSKYQLPKGVILEKAEGKPFTAADYNKLHNVLSDLNSPIKYYYEDKIIDVGHGAASEGVDAVSGASAMVEKTAIVEGAAWTTCTLWHWANGNIVPMMRKISASQFTNQELLQGFENGDKKYKILAIEELTKRSIYENTSGIIVFSHKIEDIDIAKVIITYIEKAPETIYFDSLKTLFIAANSKERILLLNSLNNTNKLVSTKFCEWLSKQLVGYKSFQELQLILRILESKGVVNAILISNAIPLLNDPQFLTARTIYWFLQNKNLSPDQQIQLELFKKKNSERL
jgi:hypothetical protein